jgi:hypothetical protein
MHRLNGFQLTWSLSRSLPYCASRLAAHEHPKSFTSLAIVLGVIALIACVVYGIRALDIG